MTTRGDPFAAIRWARELHEREPAASALAAHVLLVLATYADGDGRNCWPSRAAIAAHVRRGPTQVSGALRELQDRGEITRANGHAHTGSSAAWHLNLAKRAAGQPNAVDVRERSASRKRAFGPPATTYHDQAPPARAGALASALDVIAGSTLDEIARGDAFDEVCKLLGLDSRAIVRGDAELPAEIEAAFERRAVEAGS